MIFNRRAPEPRTADRIPSYPRALGLGALAVIAACNAEPQNPETAGVGGHAQGGGGATTQGGSGGGIIAGDAGWPYGGSGGDAATQGGSGGGQSYGGATGVGGAPYQAGSGGDAGDAEDGSCGTPPQEYVPLCPDHSCFLCDEQKLDNCNSVCAAHACYTCEAGKWQLSAVDCVTDCD